MPGIKADRKENGVRKCGAKRFNDQQGIIGIRSEDADGSSPLSLVMDSIHQGSYIINLARPFRTILLAILGMVGASGFPFVLPWDFTIQTTQVAIPMDVETE
jgi:hypothetical protein